MTAILRQVTVLHRWLGVALCLMLALWFATGSVLSFVPFPTLGAAARIADSEPVNLERVRVAPAEAMRAVGVTDTSSLRLISVNAEPRYIIAPTTGAVVAVSAVTGRPLDLLDAAAARVIAEQFSQLRATRVAGPLEYDQWTIHDKYPPQRPYFRVSLSDKAGTMLYVSARSGEVMQRTRRVERGWNRVGAIVHWLNVPALRTRASVWHWTIWSVALSAVLLTLAGLTLGYLRMFDHRRAGRAGLSPYRSWLRWHHLAGLFVGFIVLSWISSGWMSLDQGTLFSSGQPSATQLAQLRGRPLEEIASAFPLTRLHAVPAAREFEFSALDSQPLLIARDRAPRASVVYAITPGGVLAPALRLSDAQLLAAVAAGWSPLKPIGIAAIAADDSYRLRIDPLPDSARRVTLNDAEHTWVQIDAADGHVISVLDGSRRVYRWLVDGLHNFDFPVFNRAGVLWHVLLLACTSTGFAFSCLGLVLAVKRVRRSWRGAA
jgi:uncharacterized iron-regulated membrane protein